MIKPAIDLASNGFKVSPFMADALNGRYKKLGQFKNFKKIFYAEYPVIMNSRLVQPELARRLYCQIPGMLVNIVHVQLPGFMQRV